MCINIKKHGYFEWLTIISSLLLYCVALGMSNYAGWAIWCAPIPILLYAFNKPFLKTLVLAFSVYLIANLINLYYFTTILPIFLRPYYPTLFIAFGYILNSFVFAIGIVITRWIVIRSQAWYSIFTFPAYFTIYEYLFSLISPAGTNNSIAYTQMHFLSLIQIASITGIWGITFLLLLLPSSVAIAYYIRQIRTQSLMSLAIPIVLLNSVILWGWVNLQKSSTDLKTIKVALLATNESINDLITTNPKTTLKVANRYIKQIKLNASKHIDVVLLPEKILSSTPKTLPILLKRFATAAKEYHIYLIVGINDIQEPKGRNIAYLFSPAGNILLKYMKQHLVAFGPESIYQPGHQLGLFSIDNILLGVAICHDLDFQKLGRKYSQRGVQVLFVPALDFVADGWLHGRIAIMQGIENGYYVERAAQWGLLTSSDNKGRLIGLKKTSFSKPTILIGNVPIEKEHTLYSWMRDWFAWLCIVMILLILIFAI